MYSQVSNDTGYREAVESFLRQWFPGGTVKYSPRGLAAFRLEGGSIGYAGKATDYTEKGCMFITEYMVMLVY